MWQVLADTGWAGNRAWEPGCGIGIFATTAPQEVRVTGVELDPVTARLARRLHEPAGHRVVTGGIEDAEFGAGFDAAIGNVPFADVRPYHPVANPERELSLHNMAIRQALRSVQPGAPVLVITSSFTLDNTDPTQRHLLAAEGRFLGAVRLPQSAFQAQSGTQVTTDIVAFQRLAAGEEPDPLTDWGTTVDLDLDTGDGTVVGNEWFQANPDLVVGEITNGGMYSADSLRVVLAAEDLPARLRAGLGRLAEVIDTRRHPYPDPLPHQSPTTTSQPAVDETARPEWIKPGGVYRHAGEFWQRPVGAGPDVVFAPKPAKDRARLGHLVDLRDTYMRLVAAEAADAAGTEIEALRADLNRFYDRATRTGPLNEVTISVNRNGVESRRRPPFGGMRTNDPDFATLMGLEDYNADSGQAAKAAIFTQRQLHRATPTARVDNPTEAVTVALHQTGRLERPYLAELLDVDEANVDAAVAGLAYTDPDSGQLVARALYLSGDVRSKLDTARRAVATDTRFTANVEALTSVLPAALEWDDIAVQLGATWIRAEEVKAFIDETFDANTTSVAVSYQDAIGWTIDPGFAGRSWDEAFIETWGTERAHALTLVDAGLRNRAVKIYDQHQDGDRTTRVLNREETVRAAQKLDEINQAFHEWLGEDPQRCRALTDRYNRLFRSYVAPDFTDQWPRTPGLADHLTLRPHQAAAVQRLLMTDSVGLYHVVGAGKTYTMATAAMELRRLGLANKPMLVVPNHLVTQFAAEFQRAYPQAQLLIPDDRRTDDSRRRFIGQCAAGDWDCVIVPESVFLRIPVTAEAEAEYTAARADELREALDALVEGGGKRSATTKQVEKRIARLEARLDELIDSPRDHAMCFEHTGVDALFVDEAHAYKNLEVVTSRQDLAVTPSQRASDLDMKLRLMRSTQERAPVMLATGTPISNSFHELWVMMRYTSPELLERLGVDRFDSFCSQFGDVVTDYELSPTGWRLKDRFARYRNVPELQQAFAQTADVKLAADLDLPRPALTGGRPQHVLVEANPQLQAYIATLEQRSNNLPPDRTVDNRLKILGDYRKAAIDLRLVGWDQPTPSKLTATADGIARRFHDEKDRLYLDRRTGEHSPTTGSLQIVFLDAGVPGGSTHDLYNELRKELIDRGLPADQVAFIHDVKDPKPLFAAAREGRISVLVGSTGKMGTGMNVQDRATALWHIDVPWRPADIEQRNGRALRQGNQNPEVAICHVIQEGSGDALSYQGLERKERMIREVLTNTNTARTVESPDAEEINFGDIKALATGDPQVLELLRAKRTLGELEIANRSWQRRISRARSNIVGYTADVGDAEARLATLAAVTQQLGAGQVEITAINRRYDQSHNAAIIDAIPNLGSTNDHRRTLVAQARQSPITARIDNSWRDGTMIRFAIGGDRDGDGGADILAIRRDKLGANSKVAHRLAGAVANLPTLVDQTRQDLADARSNLSQAMANSTGEFRQTAELDAARIKVSTLEDALAAKTTDPPPTEAPPTAPVARALTPDPRRIKNSGERPTPQPPSPRPTQPGASPKP